MEAMGSDSIHFSLQTEREMREKNFLFYFHHDTLSLWTCSLNIIFNAFVYKSTCGCDICYEWECFCEENAGKYVI